MIYLAGYIIIALFFTGILSQLLKKYAGDPFYDLVGFIAALFWPVTCFYLASIAISYAGEKISSKLN